MATERSDRRIIACRSDSDLAEIGAITILGGKFAGELRASVVGSDADKRGALIAAVRAGTEHTELLVGATTFRQKDGVSNRRNVRFANDALEATAASFVGMPVLLDHDTRSQSSRIGTIVESSMSTHGGTGWASFNQQLKIVKPEAVISVLDGTIDRFSIGWLPTGPVLCSVHGVDVRGSDSCYCWPGDTLTIDGKLRTVEYVFSSAEGIEVSAVNVPAVKGTKVEDIRTALAFELDFAPRHPQPARMLFTRLAALLGIASLSAAPDEDRAIAAVEDLRRGKLAAEQERDTARAGKVEAEAKLALAEKAAETARLAAEETQVQALIDGAYRDGKLGYSRNAEDPDKALPSPREDRLRRIGREKDGLAALRAELAEMPEVIPVGKRVVQSGDRQQEREPTLDTGAGGAAAADQAVEAELVALAAKTGQDIKQLRAERNRIRNRRQGA